MATASPTETTKITREKLIDKLNEDLAREYQAIIAYVVYSQVLKGAEYMAIAEELKVHASEELAHALTIAKQIDYLGGMPTVKALPVKQSDDAREMLRADLENENATIRAYRPWTFLPPSSGVGSSIAASTICAWSCLSLTVSSRSSPVGWIGRAGRTRTLNPSVWNR